MYTFRPMKTPRLRRVVLLSLLVGLLGFTLAPPTADCKTDADCVLVPDDCCPCSQGGKQHAIPKKQKETYEKERKKRCTDTACTEMMSDDPSCSQHPFCGAGICELGG
jgi:hypothetical protein